jgi:hypothetical protein
MITGVFPGPPGDPAVAYARLRQDRGLCRRHRRVGRLLHAGPDRQEAQQGRAAYPGLTGADVAEVRAIKYARRRRLDDRGLSHPAPGQGRQGSAPDRPAARRAAGARRSRLRLVGPGHCVARLRGAAAQLPRLDGLRPEVHSRQRRRMGRQDADRPVGRRPLPGQARVVDPKRVCIVGAATAAMRPWPASRWTRASIVARSRWPASATSEVDELRALRYGEEQPNIRYLKRTSA